MTLKKVWESIASKAESDRSRKMKEHYSRTGVYPPEDLRRLLGNPTKGIEVRDRDSLSGYFRK